MSQKKFTKEILAHYNGKDESPVYVAYKGKVYDVTGSFLWKNGEHQVMHEAGQDLTDALRKAPHGDEVVTKFPVVGII